MIELKPKIRLLTDKVKLELSHVYRAYDTDGSTLYSENFSALQIAYHPANKHTIRFLLLSDKTTRDAERFLGDDPSLEKEKNS